MSSSLAFYKQNFKKKNLSKNEKEFQSETSFIRHDSKIPDKKKSIPNLFHDKNTALHFNSGNKVIEITPDFRTLSWKEHSAYPKVKNEELYVSNQSINQPHPINQSINQPHPINQSINQTHPINQSISPIQSINQSATPNQSINQSDTSNQSINQPHPINQSISHTQSINQSISPIQSVSPMFFSSF